MASKCTLSYFNGVGFHCFNIAIVSSVEKDVSGYTLLVKTVLGSHSPRLAKAVSNIVRLCNFSLLLYSFQGMSLQMMTPSVVCVCFHFIRTW